jgi:hypothetical protein
MTTFWKSCGHSVFNGVDLVEFWALGQKITIFKVKLPSKHALKPQSSSSHNAQCISQLSMQVSQYPRHGHISQCEYTYRNVDTWIPRYCLGSYHKDHIRVVHHRYTPMSEYQPDANCVNVYAIIIVLCISIDKRNIRTRSLRNTHSQETQHLSWETL